MKKYPKHIYPKTFIAERVVNGVPEYCVAIKEFGFTFYKEIGFNSHSRWHIQTPSMDFIDSLLESLFANKDVKWRTDRRRCELAIENERKSCEALYDKECIEKSRKKSKIKLVKYP